MQITDAESIKRFRKTKRNIFTTHTKNIIEFFNCVCFSSILRVAALLISVKLPTTFDRRNPRTDANVSNPPL